MPNDQINPADIAEAKEAYKAYLAHTAAQDDPSIVDSALNTGAKVLHGAGTVLGYPGGIVRTGLAEGSDLIGGTHLTKQGDAWRAITGDAPTTGEMLKNQGVGEMGRLSDVLPYAKKGQGQWYQPEEGGPLDVTGRGAAGFVGDVATDPLNWVTGGLAGSKNAVSATAKKLGTTAADVAEHSAAHVAGMKPWQARAYAQNPKAVAEIAEKLSDPLRMGELNREAAGHLNNTLEAVKNKGLEDSEKLKELLEGKNVELDLNKIRDIHPDLGAQLDALELKAHPLDMYGQKPAASKATTTVAANNANDLKRAIDPYAKFTEAGSRDPAIASINKARDARTELKEQLEELFPESNSSVRNPVEALNSGMGEGLDLQEKLRAMLNNPLTNTKTASDQKMAILGDAIGRGASPATQEFMGQYGAAHAMDADRYHAIGNLFARPAARASLRAIEAVKPAAKGIGNGLDTVPAWLELYLRNKQHLNQNPGE